MLLSELFSLSSLLLLILIANGAPIVARKLLPASGACPLDMGISFLDGRPLFGGSKTIRGLISAFVCTMVAAPLLGFALSVGLTVACGAMIGDLLSSFVKRRMGLQPSDRALVLDQVPESLIPALFVYEQMDLSGLDVLLLVIAFFALELALSKILFHLSLRKRPY